MSPRRKQNDRKDSGSCEAPALREHERIEELVQRARDGDEEALPALKEALNKTPLSTDRPKLAREAERSILEMVIGDEGLATREDVRRELAKMREEIAGGNPSPLEWLLVERISACWLQVQYFEALYFQNLRQIAGTPLDEYQQKRIDRAHRRHLTAVRTLAQVRKRLKPSVAQINIADKQINQAGTGSPPGS